VSRSRPRRGNGLEELRREVASGARSAFYLLHGEEDFEREETCSWLIETLAPEQTRDFNLDVFRGDKLELRDFLQVYSAYPMMASHRVVVLRDSEKLSAETLGGLVEVVDSPLETTVLIAVGGKVDLRRKFFQQLVKKGCAVDFKIPYDNQIPQWIQRYSRRKGVNIEAEGADLLNLLVGSNLRELASEIEKLQTYLGDGVPISRQAVEKGVGATRNTSIFELTDAIGERNRPKALALLQEVLDHGEAPSRVIAMLCRHFQLLLRAQSLMKKGDLGRDIMARELGISPFFLGNYLNQARNFPNLGLWGGMGALLQTDSRLKSQGRRLERLTMDLLVERLCR